MTGNKVKLHVACNNAGALAIHIETSRLYVCSLELSHLHDYYRLFSDINIMQYYEYGVAYSHSMIKEMLDHWMQKWAQNNPFGGYSVLDKLTGRLLGNISLESSKYTDIGTLEIGYLYFKEYWNKGIALEAASALVNDLLPHLLAQGYVIQHYPVQKIIATVRRDNLASRKILEKLGFIKSDVECIRYATKRMMYSLEMHCFKREKL